MALYLILILCFGTDALAARVGGKEDVGGDGHERSLAVAEPGPDVVPSGHGQNMQDDVDNVCPVMLKKMQLDTHMALENSSLLEAAGCPKPQEAFPDMFNKNSIRLLGKGGFGSAYEVEMNNCGAKKFVLKSTAVDRYGMAWSEALLAENIKDAEPGLVKSFAHAVAPMSGDPKSECMFILMEFANDKDLLWNINKLTLKHKALIFYEALKGLQNLHKRGVVHRDIKPDNIFMLTEDWRQSHALMGDYGLACCGKFGGCADLPLLEPCGECIAGTYGYMSPQVCDGLKATPEDDLWSMGKVLLQIIANTREIVYTSAEKAVPLSRGKNNYLKNLAKHIGSEDLLKLSFSNWVKMDSYLKSQGADDSSKAALKELLDHLLCNGCAWPKGEEHLRDELTSKAVILTKEWLKKLGVEPVVPDMKRTKSDEIKNCIKHPFFRAHRS